MEGWDVVREMGIKWVEEERKAMGELEGRLEAEGRGELGRGGEGGEGDACAAAAVDGAAVQD